MKAKSKLLERRGITLSLRIIHCLVTLVASMLLNEDKIGFPHTMYTKGYF